jgi:O-antigen ligase
MILCYGVIVLISAFLSFFPEESFPQLRKGFVIYLLLYLCISDNVRSFDTFKKVVLAAYLAVLAVSIIVLVQGVAYPAGSYMVKNWLVRKEAVRPFDPSTLNPLYHVQFPFSHFQKMALFLGIGLHLILLQYFITIKRISRQWVALTAFLAFAALILTLSRGALLAIFFSMILLILLTRWKYLIPVALILLLLIIFMPAVMRQYYTDLFRISEYKNPSSRVGFYLERWAVVGDLVKKYPVFGTGYGSRQFAAVSRLIIPLIRFEKRPHPYNWYLQIASESGTLGLLAFLLFSAFLLALLFQRLQQQTPSSYHHDINAALIALMVVPYIYGMVNFVHAGGLGLLVWIIYGLCASYMKLTVKFKDIDELRKEIESQETVFEEISYD